MSNLASTSRLPAQCVFDAQSGTGLPRNPSYGTINSVSSDFQRSLQINDSSEALKLLVRAHKAGIKLIATKEGPYNLDTVRLADIDKYPELSESLMKITTSATPSPAASTSRLAASSTAPTSVESLPSARRILAQDGHVILSFDAPPDKQPDLIQGPPLILSALKKVMTERGIPQNTPIAHCVDLICGSGVGSLLAVAIGALEMSVDQALGFYRKHICKVLNPRTSIDRFNRLCRVRLERNTARLERQIKRLVRTRFGSEGVHLDEIPMASPVAIVVVRYDEANMAVPYLLTSYPHTPSYTTGPRYGPRCPLWQALVATMSAPNHYLPQIIDDVQYTGGSTGLSNPSAVAETEARRLYPNTPVSLILSIGTGTRKPLTADNPQMSSREIMKGGNRVHREMKRLHSKEALGWTKGRFGMDNYFRFDVPDLASKTSPGVPPMASGKLQKVLVRWPHIACKWVTPGWGLNADERRAIISDEAQKHLERPDVQADLVRCAELMGRRYQKKDKERAVKAAAAT